MHEMIHVYSQLGPLVAHWNRLARDLGSIFCTHEWLSCWWRAFGHGDPRWLVLQDSDGSLCAGALLLAARGRLSSAANIHSGAWDAVARDDDALGELWSALAHQRAARVRLAGMLE